MTSQCDTDSIGGIPGPHPCSRPYGLAGPREWLGLALLGLPTILLGLDLTVLHLALPVLAADLQATSTQALWIMDSYGFMIAGFLVTMGTLGDRIGRRKLLMIGATGFAIASMAVAFSPTPGFLIIARAALGIAAATLMPSTLALIDNLFSDKRQRALGIGIWTTMFALGMALGPIVGGIVLAHLWWGGSLSDRRTCGRPTVASRSTSSSRIPSTGQRPDRSIQCGAVVGRASATDIWHQANLEKRDWI